MLNPYSTPFTQAMGGLYKIFSGCVGGQRISSGVWAVGK